MWINPNTGKTYQTHSDIRVDSATSFPTEISDDMLVDAGFLPVVQTYPSFNPVTHKAEELAPALVGGQWVQNWKVTALDPATAAANLSDAKTALLRKIDADVDAIYSDVIGQRGMEYADAEQAALAYQAAGYEGAVPDDVQCWAAVKNWTAKQAADDILVQAAAWRGAKSAMRAQRLARKEDVRNATTAGQVDAARSAWSGFVSIIRGQLGV
jgi:hypothetical protein